MVKVESIFSLWDTAYHLALPQVQKRNIYETLRLLGVLRYHSRSGSSMGILSLSVLTLLAGDLSVPPLDVLSLRIIILFGCSCLIYIHDYWLPLFTFP